MNAAEPRGEVATALDEALLEYEREPLTDVWLAFWGRLREGEPAPRRSAADPGLVVSPITMSPNDYRKFKTEIRRLRAIEKLAQRAVRAFLAGPPLGEGDLGWTLHVLAELWGIGVGGGPQTAARGIEGGDPVRVGEHTDRCAAEVRGTLISLQRDNYVQRAIEAFDFLEWSRKTRVEELETEVERLRAIARDAIDALAGEEGITESQFGVSSSNENYYERSE